MTSFVDEERLAESGPDEFRRSVQRLFLHLPGCVLVDTTDGPYDGGADLIVEWRGSERWAVQCKWKKSGGKVGATAVDQVMDSRLEYNAHTALVVTNSTYSDATIKLANTHRLNGVDIQLWNGSQLRAQFNQRAKDWLEPFTLHCYQKEAVQKIESSLQQNGRALLYMATGLGKTVVAGAVIQEWFKRDPSLRVLVLAHTQELVIQLQSSLWRYIPKSVLSQTLFGEHKPDQIGEGLTVGTMQTAQKYIKQGFVPDLLIIDECHHVGETGWYNEILSRLESVPRLGVTATPWRGDQYDVTRAFGEPCFSVDIVEGMANGYLSQVNYRLFCDNIDWDIVENKSRHNYRMKELNSKLFIPQRDEQIIENLIEAEKETRNPKTIVFCQTKQHAETFLKLLKKYKRWAKAELIHSGIHKCDRKKALIKFRSSESPLIVAVDILNEGVDVPDANIICFARVTHSRRIFIQQLGRGLRVSKETGKEQVIVLDFVSDLRRLGALSKLKSKLIGNDVEVLPHVQNQIDFTDKKVESLMNEWIADTADLDTASDEVELNFPDIY